MDGIACLTNSQRKTALEHFHLGENARISRRSHILLLMDRGWSWHLYETITRNHRCQTMKELASLAMEWIRYNNNYYADTWNAFALASWRIRKRMELFSSLRTFFDSNTTHCRNVVQESL